MKLSEFDYFLPEHLIAQNPANPKDSSKLLILDKKTGNLEDKIFHEIENLLGPNDVLVLNKTKVIKARLLGFFGEDKNCEIFLVKKVLINSNYLENSNDEKSGINFSQKNSMNNDSEINPPNFSRAQNISPLKRGIKGDSENGIEEFWECLVYPGKKLKVGTAIYFKNSSLAGKIVEISEEGRIIKFSKTGEDFLKEVEEIGKLPLPPYIKSSESEAEYKTAFFENVGESVAAPTASFHFTKELLEKLEKKGVIFEKVLLNVGLGTFKSVKEENILNHKMHSELIEIEEKVAERLNNYKKSGKRIISVGTTVCRTLESFALENGNLGFGKKETNIFIYPGYNRKFVDSLITNFHMPKSTLLMLVSSFAGKENIEKAYKYAVENCYRFFSFGDAMFII